MSDEYDQIVLNDLEKWVRSKGGRVQAKLISELYSKNSKAKGQLLNRLYQLADYKESNVHLVGNGSIEYLELKHLGSTPLRKKEIITKSSPGLVESSSTIKLSSSSSPEVLAPKFTKMEDYEYCFVKDPQQARLVLKGWENLGPFAYDFKGDVRREGKLAFVQISTLGSQIMILDLIDNPKVFSESGLQEIFENPKKIKVILDSARSVEAVRWLWGIEMVNVFDLSKSFAVIKFGSVSKTREVSASLVEMVKEFDIPFPRCTKPEEPTGWFRRPLTSVQIEYSARGVMYNMTIYEKIVSRAKELNLMDACIYESRVYSSSLKDAPDDREPNDWNCKACGFENFARRNTCRKCETPRAIPKGGLANNNNTNQTPPPSKQQQQQRTTPVKTVPRPPNKDPKQVERLLNRGLTADHCYSFHLEGNCSLGKECRFIHLDPNSRLTREQQLQKIEEESLRLALEVSLQEENERVERNRQAEKEEMDALLAKTVELKPGKTTPFTPSSPKIPEELIKPSTTTGSKFASLFPVDDQLTSRAPFVPFQFPEHLSSQSKYSPFLPNSFQGFSSAATGSSNEFTPRGFSSYGQVNNTNNIDDGTQSFPQYYSNPQQQVFSGLSFPFATPFATSSSPAISTPASNSSYSNNSSSYPPVDSFREGEEVLEAIQSGILSEDELLLLSLDAEGIVRKLNIDEKWINILVNCASETGARAELLQAPLPNLAKALEQSGMTVNERATILKELYARKNRLSQ